MMTKFRFHRGGFSESMATVRLANTLIDLQKITGITDLTVKPYSGIDQRNGWDTHIVTCSEGVIGFTDGMPSPTPTRRGMTVTQYFRRRFYELLEEYKQCRDFTTPDNKARFVRVSLALYECKPFVTQRQWREVNRAFKANPAEKELRKDPFYRAGGGPA